MCVGNSKAFFYVIFSQFCLNYVYAYVWLRFYATTIIEFSLSLSLLGVVFIVKMTKILFEWFFLLCFLLISLFSVAACCYMIPKNLCRLMRAEIVFIFIFISCSASRFHFIFIIPNNSNEIDFSFELSTYDSSTQLTYMY